MTLFFTERLSEFTGKVIQTHLLCQLNQYLPAITIGQFSNMNSLDALHNGHARVADDLHQPHRGDSTSVRAGRLGCWVGSHVSHGIPDERKMPCFFIAKALEFVDGYRGCLIASDCALTQKGVIESGPRSFEGQPLSELIN